MVLLQVAGSGQETIYPDVRTNRPISNGGVFKKTIFVKGMYDDTLKTLTQKFFRNGKCHMYLWKMMLLSFFQYHEVMCTTSFNYWKEDFRLQVF